MLAILLSQLQYVRQLHSQNPVAHEVAIAVTLLHAGSGAPDYV